MKGVVFTEFLEMVDQAFSPEITESIVMDSNLASGGAYTTVGTYDHGEIIALVGALSAKTQQAVPDLVKAFGQHLFNTFVKVHPDFFVGSSNAYDFLEKVDSYIHVEVRKLYPDADLPTLTCNRPDPSTLVIDYASERGLADLAHGLIEACVSHFGESVKLERTDLDPPGTAATFRLTRIN